MGTQSTLQPLPCGFHWEEQGADAALHLVAVPDVCPGLCLATIDAGAAGCVATIRTHQARAARIDRPFLTTAAASGWVARWLERQGRLIRAELASAA